MIDQQVKLNARPASEQFYKRNTESDLTRVKQWSERLSNSDHALWLIGVASFLEALIVPIPLEVVLVPFMLINRNSIWLITLITTMGCVLGAVVGYGVGFFLFQSVGQWLIDTFGWANALHSFRVTFDAYGFWAIVAVGILPIPFQVAMLTAGAASYPLVWFLLACGLARGLRYYGLAGLVVVFGAHALQLWKKHSTTAGVSVILLVICGFVVVHALGIMLG